MSWQENRRRHRTWYLHYKGIADQLTRLCVAAGTSQPPQGVRAEAILEMFYDLYEDRRLHRRQTIATSARQSMLLAIQDAGLNGCVLVPVNHNPPAPLTEAP